MLDFTYMYVNIFILNSFIGRWNILVTGKFIFPPSIPLSTLSFNVYLFLLWWFHWLWPFSLYIWLRTVWTMHKFRELSNLCLLTNTSSTRFIQICSSDSALTAVAAKGVLTSSIQALTISQALIDIWQKMVNSFQ